MRTQLTQKPEEQKKKLSLDLIISDVHAIRKASTQNNTSSYKLEGKFKVQRPQTIILCF